ncbi:ribonuclease Y [bacterium]|nr:MAG: ribonuclease Y [candidate division KSB1 bacterium]MCE7945734.1 ribonuclease Y [Chlorobi bacterium CHB1]MCL4709234.1 ribonuclease Y [bacterium]RIK75987.1 MAG: ribonuclease Y [candidate division KSB1 bacterium]
MTSLWIYVVVAATAFVLAWLLAKFTIQQKLARNKSAAADIIAQAEKEAERKRQQFLVQAKQEWFRERDGQEQKLKQRLRMAEENDQRLDDREKKLNRREDSLKQRESALAQRESELENYKLSLKTKDAELERLISAQNLELSKITQLSLEEAKQRLMENLRQEFNKDAAEIYKSIVDEAKANATREAKRILTMTIERIASEHASETSVSVVPIPSEDVKGRIIGRDGRNIKAFEQATGVKVVVDDTPEAVVLSAFDPVKREVARLALEKLIGNGKIHPQRVEDVVKSCEEEVEKAIWRAGNEAVATVGIGKIHPDMIRVLGRLHFRTSYGQNVLDHSKEVAYICGALAAELRLDVRMAKRAGLLHDIGKAISQNQEGTHTQLGMEIGKKYNEDPIVINAIGSHHEDIPADNLISLLVSAADAISGSRPGARRDTLDGYVKRIDKLEKVADGFDAVAKAYAISAGREIRVMVQPEKISDSEADLLASDIAKKIHQALEYPGQIKVTVIRETKATAYA